MTLVRFITLTGSTEADGLQFEDKSLTAADPKALQISTMARSCKPAAELSNPIEHVEPIPTIDYPVIVLETMSGACLQEGQQNDLSSLLLSQGPGFSRGWDGRIWGIQCIQ